MYFWLRYSKEKDSGSKKGDSLGAGKEKGLSHNPISRGVVKDRR